MTDVPRGVSGNALPHRSGINGHIGRKLDGGRLRHRHPWSPPTPCGSRKGTSTGETNAQLQASRSSVPRPGRRARCNRRDGRRPGRHRGSGGRFFGRHRVTELPRRTGLDRAAAVSSSTDTGSQNFRGERDSRQRWPSAIAPGPELPRRRDSGCQTSAIQPSQTDTAAAPGTVATRSVGRPPQSSTVRPTPWPRPATAIHRRRGRLPSGRPRHSSRSDRLHGRVRQRWRPGLCSDVVDTCTRADRGTPAGSDGMVARAGNGGRPGSPGLPPRQA